PFIAFGAAVALARLRQHWRTQRGAAIVLVATAVTSYVMAGAGPLAANYAPADVTEHALRASAIAEQLPPAAAVSASASLVPHLTHRARAYVFPAVLDAHYVFLDVRSS